MCFPFDQYQRYKNAEKIINEFRNNDEIFNILEVGANEHQNLEKLLPKDNITYLDINLPRKLIDEPNYILGDATEMALEDNEFDIIVALDVFEHIKQEKRVKFIQELHRVCKKGFLFSAPFDNKYINKKEIRTNDLFYTLYGKDYQWLKEHIENGLPNLQRTKEDLGKLKIDVIEIQHGDIEIWEKMLDIHFLSTAYTSLNGYREDADRLYNEYFFERDYKENAYRTFLIGVKDLTLDFNKQRFIKNATPKEKHDFLQKIEVIKQEVLTLHSIEKINEIKNIQEDKIDVFFLQTYANLGQGYSEDESSSQILKKDALGISASGKVRIDNSQIEAIRIDPCNRPCLVKIKKLYRKNKDEIEYIKLNQINTNASLIYKEYVLFENEDPQLEIINDKNHYQEICFEFEYVLLNTNNNLLLNNLFQSIMNQEKLIDQNKQLEQYLTMNQQQINNTLDRVDALVQEINYTQSMQLLEKRELKYKWYIIRTPFRVMKRMLGFVRHPKKSISNTKQKQLIKKYGDFDTEYYLSQVKGSNIHKGNALWHFVIHGKTQGLKPTRECSITQEYLQTIYKKNKNLNYEEKLAELKRKPLISVVMPVYNVELKWFKKAIDSINMQWYDNWELCIVDDGSKNLESIDYAKSIKSKKIKIKCLEKNSGISNASNRAVELANGEYIVLMDNDDFMHPNALFEIAKAINESNADIIYSDEDKIDTKDKRKFPFYKPDWSIDLLRTQMYIGHIFAFKKSLFKKVGGFRSDFNGSQDYDLALRMIEETQKIEHIPKVLYSWREIPTSTATNPNSKPYAHEAGLKALDEHLKRTYGEKAYAEETENLFVYDARYPIIESKIKVSIIIPTKDKVELLKNCIQSILDKTKYNNYEILIFNNNSIENQTFAWFEEIQKEYSYIKVIDANYDFNWSKLNNQGIKEATGDVFIFLNNDTIVYSSDWIERMAENAIRDEVGTVGALLLYEDKTIQHAGVVLGMNGWADHVFKGMQPIHFGSPYVSPVINRNVLASTGACLAISRKTIDKIGGFNEKFIICGSDVEISLRAKKHGLNNLYNARVKLYHLESKSRDEYIPEIDFEMSKIYYKQYLEKGDPYYSKNLELNYVCPKSKKQVGKIK